MTRLPRIQVARRRFARDQPAAIACEKTRQIDIINAHRRPAPIVPAQIALSRNGSFAGAEIRQQDRPVHLRLGLLQRRQL